MKTITRSMSNFQYAVQKKEVKRLKTNDLVLSTAEIKTIQKLGLDPVSLTYDASTTILKLKHGGYDYLKLSDEAIPAFLNSIENIIENPEYVIPELTYQILISNGFDIDTEIFLNKDIEISVEGEQKITLTNATIDKKLIKLLDKKFTREKFIIKSVLSAGSTSNININYDKKVLKFGCMSFSFSTAKDAILNIRESIENLN